MFIVFEGIDGCGKTAQIWKIAEYLSKINIIIYLLQESPTNKEK